MSCTFVSGIYDLVTPSPYEAMEFGEDYDVRELPIAASSDLELEEKLDIIFNLEGQHKAIYLTYIDNLTTKKSERENIDDIKWGY